MLSNLFKSGRKCFVAQVKMAYMRSQAFSSLGCISMCYSDDENSKVSDDDVFYLLSSFFPFLSTSLSLSTVTPIGEDGGAAVLNLLLPSSYRDGCGGERK